MEAVALEAANFRRIQQNKFNFFYALNIAVANNNTIPAFLTIEEDSDFLIKHITGSCYGPTDVNGVRQTNASTIFPLAGTAVPSGAGLGAYADRGLSLRMTDTGSGRELTSGFIPVETFLSPGYGVELNCPFPMSYFTNRNSKIRFDIRNRDTTANLYHFISIVFHGFKYQGV